MQLLRLSTSGARHALFCIAALGGVVACAGQGAESRAVRAESAAASTDSVVPMLPKALEALPARPGSLVRTVVVERDTTTYGTGRAVAVTVRGDSVPVADSAIRAWSFGTSSLVAVSGTDGAGGFENEGQSLTIIDVATGARRRVVSDYFTITRVEMLADGAQRALLVHMRDGGAGSMHVTVVDPARGQIFRSTNALGRIDGVRILVAGYGDGIEPVVPGDRRTPLRIDTIPLPLVQALPLLVIPKGKQ
jgi:hypothetical protein